MYQILKLNEVTGRWEFVAHGAAYSKVDADDWARHHPEVRSRLLKCRKPKVQK